MGAVGPRVTDFTQRIAIHAVPGAKKAGSAGAHGEALKVRISAPPTDGRANAELIAWLAQTFGLRASQISLISGQTHRAKLLALHWPDEQALNTGRQRLQELMRGDH